MPLERKCGECKACCGPAMNIDDPDLKKPLGKFCPKLCESGCSIYDDRPMTCREFKCAWMQEIDGLHMNARPDKSGLLISGINSRFGFAFRIQELWKDARLSNTSQTKSPAMNWSLAIIIMPIKMSLPMRYIHPDLSTGIKEMNISISDPVDINARKAWRSEKPFYRNQFSMIIPDHIYSYLKGRAIPSRRASGSNDIPYQYGSSTKTYPKTLSDNTLHGLCQSWELILEHYDWIHQVDKAGINRRIFFTFDNDFDDYKDQWSGSKHPGAGAIMRIRFVWVTGFLITVGSDDQYRYDSDKNLISRYSEKRFYELDHVKWTPDREKFFSMIQANFENIISRIDEFKSNMTERKIGKLMANQTKLLGAGK